MAFPFPMSTLPRHELRYVLELTREAFATETEVGGQRCEDGSVHHALLILAAGLSGRLSDRPLMTATVLTRGAERIRRYAEAIATEALREATSRSDGVITFHFEDRLGARGTRFYLLAVLELP